MEKTVRPYDKEKRFQEIKDLYEEIPEEYKERWKTILKIAEGDPRCEESDSCCPPEEKVEKIKEIKRLKIVSDGTMGGTIVYDSEGNAISDLTSVTIDIDAEEPLVEVVLRARNVELDLDGKMAVTEEKV